MKTKEQLVAVRAAAAILEAANLSAQDLYAYATLQEEKDLVTTDEGFEPGALETEEHWEGLAETISEQSYEEATNLVRAAREWQTAEKQEQAS